MSSLSIAAYFPFRRVRITRQNVAAQADGDDRLFVKEQSRKSCKCNG